MRDIRIRPALNGYIVHCGCQTVVFDSPKKLTEALEDYLSYPEATEQKFLKNALNKMPIIADPCDCAAPAQAATPRIQESAGPTPNIH